MSFWDDVAAGSNGVYSVSDFEGAAYRLAAEQVLYHSDLRARSDYNIVERYERDFQRALAVLGVDVDVNRQLRYACAIPRHARSTLATTGQTLLSLVMRAMYDDAARRGDLTDDGEVLCDVLELEQRYALMTQRELPAKGEFDAAMRMLQRWGIARYALESEQDERARNASTTVSAIAIRPAIVQILGETALAKLAAWSQPTADGAEPDNSNDQVDVEDSDDEKGDE